jgi:beta-glucanase (GH16 family)
MNKNYFKPIAALIVISGICIVFTTGILANASTYRNDFTFLSSSDFRKSDWISGQSEDLTWKPENVQFHYGKMTLSINNDSGNKTAGEVFTNNLFGYGMYEVRMRPIKNPGVVSSFFNYFSENDIGTEIDIEFLGYDTTKIQFNYYTNGVRGKPCLYDLGFDAADDYHIYGFNWMENSIVWYVDGEPVYEATENIPQHEAPIAMDAWPSNDEEWAGKYDGTAPLKAYYDWISYTSPEKVNQLAN